MKKILLLITVLIAPLTLSAQATANDAFNPNANAVVQKIALAPNGNVLMGGGFTSVNGATRSRMARVFATGIFDSEFDSNVDGNITAIAPLPDQKVLIAGTFSTVSGESRTNFARLNPNGTPDALFTAPNGPARSILVLPDGKFILAGNFTMVGSVPRQFISRQNADGTIDNTYNPPNPNDAVETVVRQPDGKILVGGNFNNVSGTPRQNIVRLYADGSVDTFFVASANFPVTAFAEQSNTTLVMGGQFTIYNNTQVGKLIRVNIFTGAVDPFYVPNLNGTPLSILVQPDGKIMVAGLLASVGGAPRSGVAKIAYGNDRSTYDLRLLNSSLDWDVGLNLPQPHRVFVDWSTDGVSFAPIGEAEPFGQTWQLYPFYRSNGFLRLRAVYPDASNQQSSMEIVKFIARRTDAAFDFDGDGRFDPAVFRSSTANWFVQRSTAGILITSFGANGDRPIPTLSFLKTNFETNEKVSPKGGGRRINPRSDQKDFFQSKQGI